MQEQNNSEENNISQKRFKNSSNYFLIIGIANLLLITLLYNTPFLFYYLIIGLSFLVLSFYVKKGNITALKIGVALWIVIILIDALSMVKYFNFVVLVLTIIKIGILPHLTAPLKKEEKEKFYEKGISKLPYVLPILVLVPFFAVYYFTYLITDNIYYAIASYIPPVAFLLLWYYVRKWKRNKQNNITK